LLVAVKPFFVGYQWFLCLCYVLEELSYSCFEALASLHFESSVLWFQFISYYRVFGVNFRVKSYLLHGSGGFALPPVVIAVLDLAVLSSRDSGGGVCMFVWFSAGTACGMFRCWVLVYDSIVVGGGERLAGSSEIKSNDEMLFFAEYPVLPSFGTGTGKPMPSS
jgi:hypothetical protein